MNRRLGWKKDRPDPRDKPLGALLKLDTVSPSAGSIKQFVQEILDQGNTESCVAHSTVNAYLTELAAQGGDTLELPSRLFPYWLARHYDGDEGVDEGTYVRNAFKAIAEFGICRESYWPFDPTKINQRPDSDAFRFAYDQKKDLKYYRIDGDIESGIKAAITARHPVVFGTQVDQGFMDYTGGVWTFGGRSLGGHAIYAVSYNQDGVEITNSWGKSWGAGGYGWVSWASLAIAADDFWVPSLVSNFSDA